MAPHPQAPRHRVDGQVRDSSPPHAERRKLLGTEGPDATGRKVYIWGPIRTRPPFPRRPLNPSSVDPADLSADQKAEVVGLVRLVQTDFDPEKDPNGWDSVAVLVRGVGYGAEEIRQMGYPQLAAIFRTSGAQMRLQKTGSLTCGIATSTSTVVSLNVEPPKAKGGGQRPQESKQKLKAEEQLSVLYLRDPRVALLESRSIPAVAEKEFGYSYTDRCYRDTDLYDEWRTALKENTIEHGRGWLEGDVLEAGLEIYGAKPGRSDKRHTLDAKHEAAVRTFLRDCANATARAKARSAGDG